MSPGFRLVEWASRLVPPPRRDAWRREWEAELVHAWRKAAERGAGGWRARWRLRLRAASSVVDAMSERWAARVAGASRDESSESRTARVGGVARSPHRLPRPGQIWRDVRIAARSLRNAPGFTVTVILILAAGIGASTTVFSVVDRVVLRPLPYADPGSLVYFQDEETGSRHSYPLLKGWMDLESFESIAATLGSEVRLTGEGPPQSLRGYAVSPDFFRTFGASPFLGRLLQRDDYPGDRSVVVLSYDLWTRLGADPEIVGRTLILDEAPSVVVGVLTPGFTPPDLLTDGEGDVWFALDDGGQFADFHGFHALAVAGRLRSRVGIEAAQAEVDAQREALAEAIPERYRRDDGSVIRAPLVEMKSETIRSAGNVLLMILGAAGALFLIACANVANLFLARGGDRSREVALRGALGASRSRIASLVLTESVLLSVLGGALGVGLAYLGVDLFRRFTPEWLPRLQEVAVDARILWFTAAASVGTGMLFGGLPALQAVATNVSDALKEGALSIAGRRSGRARNGLVIAEVALAVVLVAGAGLLLRSLDEMLRVDPGFETRNLVLMPLLLDDGYDTEVLDQRARTAARILDEVRAVPGVESAATTWTAPFSVTGGGRRGMSVGVTGDPALLDDGEPREIRVHPVSAGYLETLGVSMAQGRDLRDGDGDLDPTPAVLNRPAAELLWGSVNPIGRTVDMTSQGAHVVVGVVEGIHIWGFTEGVEPEIYIPYSEGGELLQSLQVLIRTNLSARDIAGDLRAAVWRADPDLPVDGIVDMDRQLLRSVATPGFLSGLFGSFATVALLLAGGGIYGTMLYTVGQRRREMGIRLALGASGGSLMRWVLRYGLLLALAGIAVGCVAGLILSRIMNSLLWGVSPDDPATFVATAAVLGFAALAASFLPAWRAARADPLETLKAE